MFLIALCDLIFALSANAHRVYKTTSPSRAERPYLSTVDIVKSLLLRVDRTIQSSRTEQDTEELICFFFTNGVE